MVIRPPRQQTAFWKKQYGGLDTSHVSRLVKTFQGMGDGMIVCPKPTAINDFQETCDGGSISFENDWRVARSKIFDLLKKVYGSFHNRIDGRASPEYSRLTETTKQFLELLCRKMPGDFLVIPLKSGFFWEKNLEARHVRMQYGQNEFGICTFLAGCILSSHSNPTVGDNQIHLECSGEEWNLHGMSDFSDVPYFHSDGDGLHLDCHWAYDVFNGFIPTSCLIPSEFSRSVS
ncbi:hypothetical protein HYW94_03685 [Candidatus Uhrbacteria bacterium]|nr:hypothetical protein [Candidatus Uhrbacteria bacterium]